MKDKEYQHLWENWKFSADQRIKAFNFFVIFSVFTNGGVFTAIEKCALPVVFVCISLFIIVLSVTFWTIDVRNQALLQRSISGLREYEESLLESVRVFQYDEKHRSKYFNMKNAFYILFGLQLLFGFVIFSYGIGILHPAKFGVIVNSCKI
jgi:hypothetical protein